MRKALFTSRNLIGDGLYVGPSLVRWHELNPDYEIDLLTHQDHVTCIYSHFGIPVNVITDRVPEFDYDFEHVFDVSKAFSYCDTYKCHLVEGYARLLGLTDKIEIGPIFKPDIEYIFKAEEGLVLISMFSASCTSRDKNHPGLPPNKMLPWSKWEIILRYLRDHFGDDKLRFLGAPTDRAPELSISEDQYMTGIPLNRLALIMRNSKCVVTLDNGMAHLAASQQAREIVFYPECLGLHYIVPKGNPRCAALHMNPVTTSASSLVSAIKIFVDTFQI